PTAVLYQCDLAASQYGLALVHFGQRRSEKGLAALRKAQEIRERLAAEHPEVTRLAVDLGQTYRTLGEQSRPAKGRFEWTDRAIRILEPVFKKEPKHRGVRNGLSWTYFGRATALTGLGKSQKALEDWQRLDAFPEIKAQPSVRVMHARTLAEL